MKFCISHRNRTIPDAKFEFDTFFGDMTHKLSLLKREQVIEFGYLPPRNGFNLFKKMSLFMSSAFFQPKIDPLSISAISKQKKIYPFSKCLRRFNKKVAATPLVVQFFKNFLRICFKDKN